MRDRVHEPVDLSARRTDCEQARDSPSASSVPTTERVAPAPTPQLFSFNNPRGACARCNGFGAILEYDESLIVPYPTRSLRDGAIDPWTKPRYDNKRRALAEFAKRERHSDGQAVGAAHRRAAAAAAATRRRAATSESFRSSRSSRRSATSSTSAFFSGSIRRRRNVRDCHGTKLQPEALNVRVGGPDDRAGRRSVRSTSCATGSTSSQLTDVRAVASRRRSCEKRATACRFLRDVGLDYLTLESRDAHALGRRSAAHRARELTRLAARRYAVRARRAVDRPASARHGPAAHAAACGCATPATRCSSSSTILRRSKSPTTWWSSDPAAASTADRSCSRARCRASRESAHGPVSHGRAHDSAAERATAARPALDHAHRRARAQSSGRRRPHSARRADRRDGRVGLGQEHARARRSVSRARDAPRRRALRQAAPGRNGRRVRDDHRVRMRSTMW